MRTSFCTFFKFPSGVITLFERALSPRFWKRAEICSWRYFYFAGDIFFASNSLCIFYMTLCLVKAKKISFFFLRTSNLTTQRDPPSLHFQIRSTWLSRLPRYDTITITTTTTTTSNTNNLRVQGAISFSLASSSSSLRAFFSYFY